MYRSILVPVDGSAFGEHALPVASAFAHRFEATLELVLVHVPQPLVAPGSPVYAPEFMGDRDEQTRDRGRVYLEGVVERVRRAARVPVRGTLLEGQVAERLEQHVREARADLIVMTSHGRGGPARAWLGSVAERVVRHAEVPVVVVHPTDAPVTPGDEFVFRHLLLPLDGSRFAEGAIGHATAIARRKGARVTVLTVAVALAVPLLAAAGPPPFGAASAARAYAERVAASLREEGVEAEGCVRLHANVARAILECADEHATSLIVMATHGHGAAGRVLLGGVADKVMRAAHAPVLLHRPPLEAAPASGARDVR